MDTSTSSQKIVLFVLFLLTLLFLTGCSLSYTFHAGKKLDKEDAKLFQVNSTIEPITGIDISTSVADIEILEGDSYKVEINYYYWETKPDYSIESGILHFDDSDVYPDSYSLNFDPDNSIKIYLPDNTNLKKVDIGSSSGDVKLGKFITDELVTDLSYGDLTIDNVAAINSKLNLSSGESNITGFNVVDLEYENSYGDADFTKINLGDTLLPGTLSPDEIVISMSSGNCNISGLIGNSLDITSSYGNIECRDVNVKDLSSELSSGDLSVTKSLLTSADISDSYGDVFLNLSGKEENYAYDLDTSYGKIRINGNDYDDHLNKNSDGEGNITAKLSSGDIIINFE